MELRWVAVGMGLFFIALGTLLFLTGDDGSPGTVGGEEVVVEVDAYRYAYSPGSNESINITHGSMVTMRITSHDVTHGLAITGYGINVEIPAGETVVVRFRADQAGEFQIYCTVFCGVGHPEHKGTLHVA